MAIVPEKSKFNDGPEAQDRHMELLLEYLKDMKVDALGTTISNPPTQSEVQAIVTKLDELIGKIHTA